MLPFFMQSYKIDGIEVNNDSFNVLISNRELSSFSINYDDVLFFMFDSNGGRLKASFLTKKGWLFKYGTPLKKYEIEPFINNVGIERIVLIRRLASIIILSLSFLCFLVSYLSNNVFRVAFMISGFSYIYGFYICYHKLSCYKNVAGKGE
ncbi:hypothetical protein [Halobacteriovorax sp. DPLXC-1]|uniref:hypothetical protein n=1 Tax=Halobacteriovorax sp. DPLXC-1 TaxID=3110771 RepID=UPI002FEE71BF